MNTQKKTISPMTRNHDISTRTTDDPNDKRRWYYIDLKEFEFQIRQEELEKYMALRAKERKSRQWKREAQADLFKLSLIPRMCGIFMIFMSIFTFIIMSKVFGETDGTWVVFMIFLGVIALICPGFNKPRK